MKLQAQCKGFFQIQQIICSKLQKRKEEARRAALEKVGAAVFKSNDGKKKGWKKNARVDKSGIFNNEEKEDMDVYDDDDEYGDDDDFED